MKAHKLSSTVSSVGSFEYTILKNLGLCVVVEKDLRSFLHILYYLRIALCSLGILGSIVAVVVCIKRKLRSSCSVQLAILSAYDIIFLLTCLVIAVLGLKDSWDSLAAKVFLCLRTLALWGATYTTLDICAERYLSLAYPFIAHSRFTVGLALKRAGVIVVLGLGFTLPFLLDLINGYSVGEECYRQRQLTTFGLVYTLYISLLLLYLLPFTAIIVINIIFAVTLCRLHRRDVRPKRENVRAQEQLSALVLGLSGWYVVTMLLPSLLFLVRLTRLELFEPSVDIRIAAVADTLVVLCCCSNFIFYFLLWRPFRQVLCGWLGRGWGWVCGKCERVRRATETYHTRLSTNTSNHTPPVVQISYSVQEGLKAKHEQQSILVIKDDLLQPAQAI